MHCTGKRIALVALAVLFFEVNANAEIELPQADGSSLVIPQAASSIITLAPNLTELAFAAGAGEQVIATVEYSEFPQAASALPRVGDAFRLDLERILALKPDLVVAWQSGNPQQAIARLQALGIPTWIVEIRRPEDIATTLEWFGLASGHEDEARKAAAQAQHKLEELSDNFSGLPPVSYFYQVAAHPLFTLNGEHLIAQSFALCGGVNVFQNESALAPQVSTESVIAANPDVLLAPALPGQPDPLQDWRAWSQMTAVRNGRLYTLFADEISRATPRMLDAVSTGCRLMHQDPTRSQNE